MSTKAQAFVVHPLKGGLDTMSAPTIMPPDSLQTARNIDYFARGSVRKRLGTTLWSSTPILDIVTGNAIKITAMKSFRHYETGTREGTQHLVVMGGSSLYAAGEGVLGFFSPINSGIPFGATSYQGNILIAGGYAIFATMLGTQIPKKWDGVVFGAGVTDLDDCAPKFGFAEQHLRRVFASGVLASPSTVFYSGAGDVTDWESEDTGSLVLDDGDGDRIVGISKTFRGGIYVFKGGEKGSIHSVMGRSVRQFTRDKIQDTAPAVSHASIVTTPNDIYWLSPYGVHSLVATEKYGNTQEAFVSHDIHNLFQDTQADLMGLCWGFYHPLYNIVGWAVPEGGISSQPNLIFVYNYALGKWAVWSILAVAPTAGVIAPDLRPLGTERQRQRLYIGSSAGTVYRGDETARTDAGVSILTTVKFPNLIRLGETMSELAEKSFQSVTTFFSPTATAGAATLNVTIDGRLTTHTVSLQATGGLFGTGQFDTTEFGGNSGVFFTETPIMDRGRAIELEYVNDQNNTDMQIYGYAIRAVPAEGIPMEAS